MKSDETRVPALIFHEDFENTRILILSLRNEKIVFSGRPLIDLRQLCRNPSEKSATYVEKIAMFSLVSVRMFITLSARCRCVAGGEVPRAFRWRVKWAESRSPSPRAEIGLCDVKLSCWSYETSTSPEQNSSLYKMLQRTRRREKDFSQKITKIR